MASLVATFLRRANNFIKVPQSFSSIMRTFVHLKPLTNTIEANSALNLTPQLPLWSQVCGFKVKYKLKKRCKDCYFVVRDSRTYVICPTHPRHKQMSMVKKPKYTWIISHACQSKIRPW